MSDKISSSVLSIFDKNDIRYEIEKEIDGDPRLLKVKLFGESIKIANTLKTLPSDLMISSMEPFDEGYHVTII